jgi:nitroimidazol reductase NimA-like FMN-containing flavoprotein (pyridoxamine 5'-phosphate oxidase superfamily)
MHDRRQPVPSRTNQLIVLDPAECRQLLLQQKIGRIAVTISGQPHVVPVTYAADEDGNVVFRTGPDTVLTRVDLELVAFEIDGVDERTKSGWSVCVHGFGREITGDDDQITRHLRQKLGASWAPGPRPRWFAVSPRESTGRRLQTEEPPDDEGWFPGIPRS